MLRGLYVGAQGMKVQSKVNDLIANNLANARTVGYKKDTGVVTRFPDLLLYRVGDKDKRTNPSHLPPQVGYLSTGVILAETVPTVNVAGVLRETGNPVDVAITGNGYFVVNTDPELKEAGERYTRQGNFQLTADGMLVTGDGYPVQGEEGNIYVSGGQLVITGRGEIVVEGSRVDRLRLVTFTNENGASGEVGLEKTGQTMFYQPNRGLVVPATGVEVQQGFVEDSNVNPVAEMVTMIQALRAYEANQKAVQAHDQALDKAVNDVGRS